MTSPKYCSKCGCYIPDNWGECPACSRMIKINVSIKRPYYHDICSLCDIDNPLCTLCEVYKLVKENNDWGLKDLTNQIKYGII